MLVQDRIYIDQAYRIFIQTVLLFGYIFTKLNITFSTIFFFFLHTTNNAYFYFNIIYTYPAPISPDL